MYCISHKTKVQQMVFNCLMVRKLNSPKVKLCPLFMLNFIAKEINKNLRKFLIINIFL